MKGKWTIMISILTALLLWLGVRLALAQEPQPSGEGVQPQGIVSIQANLGTAFTYQGQLKKNGSPVNSTCDFQFSLYDAASGGSLIGVQTITGITVTNGLFTVQLDFGAGAFQGNARWLQIAVKCTGDASYNTLSLRQPLTPSPYALALPGLRTQQNADSPNIIGGYSGNSVTAGVVGATIGGGGASGSTNSVTDNYGTVSGGSGNTAGMGGTVGGGGNNTASGENATVGGGGGNQATAPNSTVGGGYGNNASGGDATIGGGHQNTASGPDATIGGGQGNTAGNSYATVGGGYGNTAGGYAATVPGGLNNAAQGDYSFAAGRRAKADHQGAFVWADSTDADFASTADNQFAVRATGGVSFSIGTSNFLVNGNTVWNEGNDGSGSGLDADTVDGVHGSQLALRAYNTTVPAGQSVTIEIPHYTPFTLHLASGWPDIGGVAFVQGFENDYYVAITYIAYNGNETSKYGGAECRESSTTTLLSFGSGSYIYTVQCPGEELGPHNLVLTATGVELRYTLIY